jgi:hypothetical protein
MSRRRKNRGQSNYIAPLRHHLANSPPPNGLRHIEVLHDDWCAFFKQRPCDCNPEIVSGPAVDAKYGTDAP